MIEQLFSTPVGHYDLTSEFGDFEAATAAMIETFPARTPESNLMNFPLEFAELRRLVNTKVNEYRIACGIHQTDLVHFDGFFNEHRFGDKNTCHGHPFSMAVAIYYLRAQAGHGDLLLHDPRGSTMFSDIVDTDTRGLSGYRTFRRFTPLTGELFIFPGYLIHSVEPSQIETPTRLSIGMNFFHHGFIRRFNRNL